MTYMEVREFRASKMNWTTSSSLKSSRTTSKSQNLKNDQNSKIHPKTHPLSSSLNITFSRNLRKSNGENETIISAFRIYKKIEVNLINIKIIFPKPIQRDPKKTFKHKQTDTAHGFRDGPTERD